LLVAGAASYNTAELFFNWILFWIPGLVFQPFLQDYCMVFTSDCNISWEDHLTCLWIIKAEINDLGCVSIALE
jgi:hypothetical protein